mmetsp:Transcript_43146/g.133511  ORF Transcript_43146/g.133511 Transcript_43146/m.133511 type:complete len:95 (+) Transcript_43146:78-362(+)
MLQLATACPPAFRACESCNDPHPQSAIPAQLHFALPVAETARPRQTQPPTQPQGDGSLRIHMQAMRQPMRRLFAEASSFNGLLPGTSCAMPMPG